MQMRLRNERNEERGTRNGAERSRALEMGRSVDELYR